MTTFTEHMRAIPGMCAPHRLMAITGWKPIRNMHPDRSRMKIARGEKALFILTDALDHPNDYEWLDLISKCGEETVVEYIRREDVCDPIDAPEPLLEPEKQEKRKVKVEVEGR